MKRILSVLLIASLLLCVASCSGKSGVDPSADSSPATSPSGNASLPPFESSVNDLGFDEGACIASTVLFNDAGIATVTATDIAYEESGATLHLEIKNHSDTDLQFDADRISVNGLMNGFANFDFISAGQTAVEDISFSYNNLILGGVTVFSEITVGELTLTASDDAGTVTAIGPVSVYTNAYGKISETKTAYEAVLSEDNQQRIGYKVLASSNQRTDIATGVYASASVLTESEDGGPAWGVILHNETDKNVSVALRDPVINGIRLAYSTVSFIVDLAPDCYSYHSVDLSSYGVPGYCFDALGLSSVQDVTVDYALEQDGTSTSESVTAALSVTGAKKTEGAEGKLVYDKDGLKIRSFGAIPEGEEENYVGAVTVLFLFENNTGKDLELQDEGMGDLLLNGKSVQFYSQFCCIANKTVGAVGYNTCNSMTDDLNITSVSEISDGEMTFRVSDSNAYAEPTVLKVSVY